MTSGGNVHKTCEEWQLALFDYLRRDVFAPAGYELPTNIRVNRSFASRGGLAPKRRVMGQAWDQTLSEDGHYEVLISPNIDAPLDVAATGAHEAVHIAVGLKHGHKGPFKRCALAIGLEGPMGSTKPGPAFLKVIAPILEALGPYPNARLGPKLGDPSKKIDGSVHSGPKAQTGRMRKAQCEECGLILRLSNTWITDRKLTCPDLNCSGHDRLLNIS